MGDVPNGNGAVPGANGAGHGALLVSLPSQFRTLAGLQLELTGMDTYWPQTQPPAQLPDAQTRSQPAWPRAPTAQEVSQLAWMANQAQQQAGMYSQQQATNSMLLQQQATNAAGTNSLYAQANRGNSHQSLASNYLDTPYFDLTSLSTSSPLYSTPPLNVLGGGGSHSAPSNVQQPAKQQRQSAADHLLSQLVNDAASRLHNSAVQTLGGDTFLSTGSNALGSGGHLQLLSSQMAALSLPSSSSTLHHQQQQQQQQQQPKPQQQRQQLLQQQQQQLEAAALEADMDAYGSSIGPDSVPVDAASSNSLTNLTSASTAEMAAAPVNSASLYVKNLSPDTDELYLYQKFSPHGALLSCKVKTDPTTGKCRGVGFVNYVDQACALRAMQQLHGSRTAEGRQLHITIQAPRAVRAAAAAAAAVPGTSPRAGAPALTTNQQIHDLMQQSLRP